MSDVMPQPTSPSSQQLQRRSQLYRWHAERKASFEKRDDTVIVAAYEDIGQDIELQIAARLGLADLSTYPRIGFKGPDTVRWLQNQGLHTPDAPNRASQQMDGSLVARLSTEEHLILSDLSGSSQNPEILAASHAREPAPRCYDLPRADSHCWFMLSGQHAAAALAKQCQVDLRPAQFDDHSIAQTSLAHVNAIIIRDDRGANLAFHILSDVSSAEYLWHCLLDSMQEFDGAAIGLNALRKLKIT